METEEEIRLKYRIQDLKQEIEKLQAKINKQADEIFEKDCEISRLEEYEHRCHRSYDAWVLDPER